MSKINNLKWATAAALAAGLAMGVAKTANAELTSAELVRVLQTGGHVVYMRHTLTDRSQEDLDHANLDNCATQRNLSEEGRQQARVIAQATRQLRIQFDSVMTSPYCRAKETASLAFGGGQLTPSLRYLSHQPENEQPYSRQEIRRMLSTPPSNGGNTILVSHTENLKQTAGIWPKNSGVMHVFEPQGDGSFRHLGKIDPGEWTTLTQLGNDETCIWFVCW